MKYWTSWFAKEILTLNGNKLRKHLIFPSRTLERLLIYNLYVQVTCLIWNFNIKVFLSRKSIILLCIYKIKQIRTKWFATEMCVLTEIS